MRAIELREQLNQLIEEYGDLSVYYFADAYPDQKATSLGHSPEIFYNDLSLTLPERLLLI